jgi:hypothetical protein
VTDTELLDFIGETNGKYTIKHYGNDWMVWDCSDGLELAGEGETLREALTQAYKYFKGY